MRYTAFLSIAVEALIDVLVGVNKIAFDSRPRPLLLDPLDVGEFSEAFDGLALPSPAFGGVVEVFEEVVRIEEWSADDAHVVLLGDGGGAGVVPPRQTDDDMRRIGAGSQAFIAQRVVLDRAHPCRDEQ